MRAHETKVSQKQMNLVGVTSWETVGRIILFGIIKKSNRIKQEINKKVKLKHFELSLGQGESV